MAFCSNCGHQLADGEKFCAGCGRALEVAQNGNEKRTVYDGKIHKCPNCGELLDSFTAVCPVCNYELRGTQTTSCVHELSQKLEKTDLLEKKIELISNFYIPNTKEDIYEFFILAYSNITGGGYGIDAWKVKLEQAYLKAKLAFGDSADFKYIDELYSKIKKASLQKTVLKSKLFKATIVFSLGVIMMLGGFLMPGLLSISDNTILGPCYFIGMLGILPFLAGLIMFFVPEKKSRNRK